MTRVAKGAESAGRPWAAQAEQGMLFRLFRQSLVGGPGTFEDSGDGGFGPRAARPGEGGMQSKDLAEGTVLQNAR
ncbi:hypothetical protein ASD48_21030 [Streptomyces sp. Root1310]|nr:hypothetical protein ASD48_21030 [Streptomyces sp. Root1310]